MVQLGSELSSVYEGLRRGRMSRREFVMRAAALGVSTSADARVGQLADRQ